MVVKNATAALVVRFPRYVITGCVSLVSDSHCCGLAGTIVSQEGDHLVLMQVQAQFVQRQFAASLVHFGQFVYAHNQWKVAGLLLYAPHLLCHTQGRKLPHYFKIMFAILRLFFIWERFF